MFRSVLSPFHKVSPIFSTYGVFLFFFVCFQLDVSFLPSGFNLHTDYLEI